MSSAAGAPEPPVAPRGRSPAWLSLLVLALGATAALLLVATFQLRERLLAESSAVIMGTVEIRREVAVAHLWLEEYVSGDAVDLQGLHLRLERAGAAADALVTGARLDDPLLRSQVKEVRRQLDGLREVAGRRLAGLGGPGDIGIGSPLDQEFDRLFGVLDASAAGLERLARDRQEKASSRAQVAFLILWTGWLAVVGFAAWGLYSNEQHRRHAEEALRRSEAQLVEAQRLEAVGRLAGGLAHDMNNYIAAISSQCELVQEQVPAGGPIDARMKMVLGTAGKVTALIRRLLAFSRQQPIEPELLDLDGLVRELAPTLQGLLGEAVQLEVRRTAGLWCVEADPTQVEQVVVNLVVNAKEAGPAEGLVTVETANCRLGARDLRGQPAVPPGDYVRLAVTDRGTGIPAAIRDRIFEPFFTTKPGSARGLGLATIYGIARRHGGFVAVASEPGKGTTFEVYLPRALTATRA
ncbi:MAG TPA: hypothetical protein DD490_03575 [Acidobacteria bacterium]|nr:hypothetical protein [Acidobacteriota bacterium]